MSRDRLVDCAAFVLGAAVSLIRPTEITDLRLRMVRLESELIDLQARVGELYVQPGKVEQRP